MMKKIGRLLFHNPQLKITALVLALLVWVFVASKERTYAEKTIRVPVQTLNVSNQIEVRGVKPEEVQLTLRGPAKVISALSPENCQISIDLREVNEAGKLNFYGEDHLKMPQGVQAVSIHPKMIEITVDEFVSHEVPVQVRLKGKLPRGWQLHSVTCVPDKVTVIGYRSQLNQVTAVYTEDIDLSLIEKSVKLNVLLRPMDTILKFVDRNDVEVQIQVESTGK